MIEPRGCALHAPPRGNDDSRRYATPSPETPLPPPAPRRGLPTCIQTPSEPQAEQPFLLVGAIEQFGQREFALRAHRRTAPARHDRGTRIDERNHLMLPALAQRAVGQHGIVAASAIADAAGGRRHHTAGCPCASGSKASASRARLDRTPSIHSVSALTTEKNGVCAEQRQRPDDAPPSCRAPRSRSSEMITRGRAAGPDGDR